MTTPIAIVGVGGQGRECLDIAEAVGAHRQDIEVVGFYDDAPAPANIALIEARGYRLLGTFEDLLRRRDVEVCLGVGHGPTRAALHGRLRDSGLNSPVLVHPDSTMGSAVFLEQGVVVFAGSRLSTNITVGRHVHVNQNAAVGHDAVLDDYVTLNPMAAVSGSVHIARRATVGAGATVLQGLVVGEDAVVGAGACVVEDVPGGAVVKGVPAR